MSGAVRVSLLYLEGCPNRHLVDKRLRQALAAVGLDDAELDYRQVSTPEEAEELGLRGSPTVLVNGQDPFGDRARTASFSCRIYRTPDGLHGSPTVEQLVEALR
jgi:hypothetical protein